MLECVQKYNSIKMHIMAYYFYYEFVAGDERK